MDDLKRTILYATHVRLGAKIVPFAGYEMPVQFANGVMKEHLHCRQFSGLFDVSHMGQVTLRPKSGNYADAALALEKLVPVSILDLKPMRQRYGVFTNENGGILDDLMLANLQDRIFVVVNAACKDADIAHMHAHLSDVCDIEVHDDRALIALQGPAAEAALASISPQVAEMRFMDVAQISLGGADCIVSRSGYSGEDGFEISVPNADAVALCDRLLALETVESIGLGARDSLRLEAGLCLYGNDLDQDTTPSQGAIEWAIQKVRRKGGAREGGFPGAARILDELENGASRRRVGILPEGRAPMRQDCAIFAQENDGDSIGTITSGAFGPSLGQPMSMGYVEIEYAATGTEVFVEVRGKRLVAKIADMPFRPSTYKR